MFGLQDRTVEYVALNSALNNLTDRQVAVVAMISSGFTQEECGIIGGMTRASIGLIYKRAIKILSDFMNREEATRYVRISPVPKLRENDNE